MNRRMAMPLGVWRAVQQRPLLALLNLAGFPALALVAWGGLYLPDSNILLVLLSLALVLLLLAGVLLLLAYTFCVYHAAQYPTRAVASQGIRVPPDTPLFPRALRAIPLLGGWLLVFGIVCTVLTWMLGHTENWSKPVASWLTMLTQQPVNFYSVAAAMNWVLEFLRWVLTPMVFIATFAGIMGAALRKEAVGYWMRHSFRLLKSPVYWVAWLAFLAIGLWLPGKLVFWVPVVQGVPAATASMLVRFGVALLLIGGAWLLFLSTVARLLKHPRQNLIVFRRTQDRPA